MTLRRRLAVGTAAMILGLLLLSAASLWGLYGLRRDHGLAVRGYESLRNLFEVAAHVNTARTLLELGDAERPAAARELADADAKLKLPSTAGADTAALAGRIEESRSALLSPDASISVTAMSRINAALAEVASRAAATRVEISRSEQAAEHRLKITTTLMSLLAAMVIAVAIVVGVQQYRRVIDPLRRLGETTRQLATRDLAHRAETTSGDAEFRALAADFNRMASELETLYQSLERQIVEKSRDLVRSERLASVGYLAAGVAHEINNPLGIIAAHAELLIQRLERDSSASPQTSAALKVVCEEAFRCKQITERLLDLSRPTDESRQAVDVVKLIREVVELVRALPQARDRSIHFNSSADASAIVSARPGEIKQVLINLILNALPAGAKHMTLQLHSPAGEISIEVRDDGDGMSPDILDRVFEPFFTARRIVPGGEETLVSGSMDRDTIPSGRGTGLGLSISHAIIRDHGGSLSASSDGPGRGSVFTIVLPRMARPDDRNALT